MRVFSDFNYGAYSLDGGTTWTDFITNSLPAINGYGSIAVSADGSRFVWIPSATASASKIAYYSTNNGANWTASTGGPTGSHVPISDRVNSNKFYIYSSTRMYVSTDGGATFIPSGSLASGGGTPCAVFGHEGDIWVPLSSGGLTHSINSGASFTTVPGVQNASFVSVGKAAIGQSYPAVFISGQVGGVTGIFRSDNAGVSWTRINDDQHQFGLGSILDFCGDPRVYGRVYFGTQGRGIIYGDLAIPPAPTNLIASAGDGQVMLTWAASYGATNYFIKQSTIGGGSYLVVGTNVDIAFTNTGLNNGSIYYYVVSALNASGESTNSMEVSARPVSLLPTQINLAIASSQMQLTWPQDHTGWQLQVQTNPPGNGLGTNWTMIFGSGLTNRVILPADSANSSVFFRLISP